MRETAEGPYDAVNYHSFADDRVIRFSGHSTLAWRRLSEHVEPLGVTLNREKTRMVNLLHGGAFSFLGFDLWRVSAASE